MRRGAAGYAGRCSEPGGSRALQAAWRVKMKTAESLVEVQQWLQLTDLLGSPNGAPPASWGPSEITGGTEGRAMCPIYG